MSNGDCATGASNTAKIEGLEDGMTALRKEFADLRKVIEQALKRPGWAALTIISILLATSSALVVALIGAHGG